jgi:ABC-type spermidine/putrescine transport system permease subunit II
MVVFTFLYLPIAVMVLFAFNKPSPAALEGFTGSNVCDLPPTQVGNVTVWNGFTTCWFNAGLHDPTYIPAILTSVKIAAAAAIVSTALGLGAALALARMNKFLRVPFDSLVYLTLVVPEIVIATADALRLRHHEKDARTILTPLANDPHQPGAAAQAKKLLDKINGVPEPAKDAAQAAPAK